MNLLCVFNKLAPSHLAICLLKCAQTPEQRILFSDSYCFTILNIFEQVNVDMASLTHFGIKALLQQMNVLDARLDTTTNFEQ